MIATKRIPMAVKIRLRQQGRKNHRVYRLVVADARSPRDGKYIEAVGHYNPHAPQDKEGIVHADRIQHWINHGAILTEKAEKLVARHSPSLWKEIVGGRAAKRNKARIARKKKGE
ncbi:MAG: 30S ribosomal protein S16 [Chlamydiota bacterium]|nr:30S ribosomal protein S16 [Chlamydiota bacterium]